MKKFVLLCVLAFVAINAFAVDTLEVFGLRVQFQEEKNDNSLTTGTGLFDSDTTKYSLDPTGKRGSVPYWKKHFEFANAYFNAATGGRLVIKSRIFPEDASAYTLDKYIIDYNRTSKKKGEKTAEFDEARSRDYLSFVYDAIMKAHGSKESPFKIPQPKSSNTKRVYMIIHAGANRLVDGGSMGTKGANTPGDFMDVFISEDAWEYLSKDSAYVSLGVSATSDTVAVNGLTLKGASIDTLKSVMVVSETASQDKLNWGINGIIINQIARQLGLPNTYDVVKGISRLGYFDVMDFAGYSAGNGFLPSLPNAWARSYMGWSAVKEVRPTAGKGVTVEIAAAGSGLGTEIVKVPLNGSEYLLIENRQRSWNKEGTVDFVVGNADESNDTLIKTLPVDSLSMIFEDSVCVKGKCKVNKNKAKGLILSASSFDAGIPASGIAVWKVNDWYLRETLRFGAANFWGGDTLRDHQFGMALVESDGVLSIGKTFKNALGEDTYDYGSGTDLLPHLRMPNSSSSTKYDTVKTILPKSTGASIYANTNTTQGGYTGIKIKVEVPKDARVEKTANAFMGDSVKNFAATKIKVTISLDDGRIDGSQFPRNVGVDGSVRGMVFVNSPEDENEKLLVVEAADGYYQLFSALGDTLYASDTSVVKEKISAKDSREEIPLYRLGQSEGSVIGSASNGKSIFSLYKHQLIRTDVDAGYMPTPHSVLLKKDSALVGPMLVENRVWVATTNGLVGADFESSEVQVKTDENFVAQDMAYCPEVSVGKSSKVPAIALVGKNVATGVGQLVLVDVAKMEVVGVKELPNKNKDRFFNVVCTDLNRDGILDVAVLGSRGTVAAFNAEPKFAKVFEERSYTRGNNKDLPDETSPFAVGDINSDGYPELVFLGQNLLYALDRYGMPLGGFPVTLNRGTPICGFFSDPLLVDVNGDKNPEILVPSSDGMVYAYKSNGKQYTEGFPLAAGSFEYGNSYYPMSIFVVKSKAHEGPKIYAMHRNYIYGFNLPKAMDNAAESEKAWPLPAGGNERTNWFDASKLKDVSKDTPKAEITEFFVYPNPVRGGNAKARFEIGDAAKSATFELYDITGLCIYKKKMSGVAAGRGEFDNLDLSKLGSDVYTARLKVNFESGKTKQKLYRIGVIK